MEHDHEARHDSIVEAVSQDFASIMDNSTQSIYIYLDDTHKACNKKFATMLGYTSPKSWAAVNTNFPEAFVAKMSQRTLVSAYQEAMEHGVGSTIDVTWKRKDGMEVGTTTILVPIVHSGHSLALHFITEK